MHIFCLICPIYIIIYSVSQFFNNVQLSVSYAVALYLKVLGYVMPQFPMKLYNG